MPSENFSDSLTLMVDQLPPPPLPKSQPAFTRRNSTILKLLGVGGLILVMIIPLLMINGVLSDRLTRRNEAVVEITSSWGKEQNVVGPVLGIPYQYRFKTVKEMPLGDGRVERAKWRTPRSRPHISFRKT